MLKENIKRLRAQKGLSQQELAERLHVVRQTVSKWEKGLSEPDASMLLRLAEELGCSPEELLGTNEAALGPEPAKKGKRIFEGILLAGGIVSLLAAAKQLAILILSGSFAKKEEAGLAIIGGADGPTAIFVASAISRETGLFLLLLIAALCFGGWFFLRRKK